MSLLKIILPLLLIAGSPTSYALSGSYDIDAYAGAEPKIRRMEFKKHYGNRVFKDPFYTSINVFLGSKINQYFSIEAGYELSDTKINSKYGKNGSFLFGSRLIDNVNGLDSITNFIYARSKISGFNMNLMISVPLNNAQDFNLIGLAGLGHLISSTRCDLFEIGETNISLHDHLNVPVQRFVHNRSRYKNRTITIRFRSGFQYLANNNFGIRALAGWENTHKIKIQGKDCDNGQKLNEHAKFKDSISYSVGFFVPF